MKMSLAFFGAALLALPCVALAQSQAGTAHQTRQTAANQGLFPPNQVVPEYATGADSPDASMANPDGAAPNAGNTGLNPSGNNYGWWEHGGKP